MILTLSESVMVCVVQCCVSRDDLLSQAEKVINDLGATKSISVIIYKHVTIYLVLGWYWAGPNTGVLHFSIQGATC